MDISRVSRSSTVAQPGTNSSNHASMPAYIFDVSSHADPLDKDLQEVVLMLQSSDLSALAQVLIMDVLRTLSTIRKQQLQNAHADAVVGLNFGKSAAQHQKNAAKSAFTAEIISSTATMAQSAVELGTQAAGAYQANKGMAQINKQANEMDFSDSPTAQAQGQQSAPVRPADAPPVYTEKADMATPEFFGEKHGMPTLETAPMPTKGGANLQPSDEPLPTPRDGATPAPRGEQNATRRQEWITTAARNMYSKLDMRNHSLQASGTLASSAAKIGSGAEQKNSGDAHAEATIAQALDRYFQNKEQFEASFGQDMKQAFAQALEFVKQAEQARHQSASAIANV